jgi:hypothetical protein
MFRSADFQFIDNGNSRITKNADDKINNRFKKMGLLQVFEPTLHSILFNIQWIAI